MKRTRTVVVLFALAAGGCARRPVASAERPTAFGTAVALVSGEKQAAGVGAPLDQPLVIQVNDASGMPVVGALVRFAGAGSMAFQPDLGLTGADGQFTTIVTLGGMRGHYEITASTVTPEGKSVEVRVDEIALGYQEMLGKTVSEIHCIRCHESESTPERVSNHDNLEPAPHALTDGSILNAMSDSNLLAIVRHGGPALNKSPEMPPYQSTLSATEIDALIAYLRAVADPPYRPQGVFYAAN